VNVINALDPPITIAGMESLQFPALQTNAPLNGTSSRIEGTTSSFSSSNAPKFVNGILLQPQLTFADPATVKIDAGQGKWGTRRHPHRPEGPAPSIVLTKDGVVKDLIQATFK